MEGKLTDDPHKDRAPRWSPDGKRIAFYSNRSGRYEIWTINAEGSGLEQITYTSGASVNFPVWSPDGTRLAYSINSGSPFIMEVGRRWKEQSPKALPRFERDQSFQALSWSPDGRSLAGYLVTSGGAAGGIATYSLESGKYERLTDFGMQPVWLKDSRRLLFSQQDKVYLIDAQSKKAREIFSVAPPSTAGGVTICRDNRTIYFSLASLEADIWLATVQ